MEFLMWNAMWAVFWAPARLAVECSKVSCVLQACAGSRPCLLLLSSLARQWPCPADADACAGNADAAVLRNLKKEEVLMALCLRACQACVQSILAPGILLYTPADL